MKRKFKSTVIPKSLGHVYIQKKKHRVVLIPPTIPLAASNSQKWPVKMARTILKLSLGVARGAWALLKAFGARWVQAGIADEALRNARAEHYAKYGHYMRERF